MTKSDTTTYEDLQTQSESCEKEGQEIQIGSENKKREIMTGAYYSFASIPSDLPEAFDGSQNSYIFRIGDKRNSERVTITINTKQLIEQARVRKINQAIRRASSR